MRTTRVKQVERQILVSITCDKCQKEYTVANDDNLEIQEFHTINFVGGYSSVFGDSTTVRCDICQHCLKQLIGDFAVIEGVQIIKQLQVEP